MKVLITGGSGRLGSLLTEILTLNGFQVQLLVRTLSSKHNQMNNIEKLSGDLLNLNSLKEAVNHVSIVIHAAGITHARTPASYKEVNIKGTQNILQASEASQVNRFIFISSRSANLKGGAYAESKLLAESSVQRSSLKWTILRLGEVYGGGRNDMIFNLVNLIKDRYLIPVIGTGKQTLCPIHIEDALQAIVETLKNEKTVHKTYNIAGPEEVTYKELIDRISSALNVKKRKLYIPLFFAKILARLLNMMQIGMIVPDQIPRLLVEKSSDISLAKNDLSFHPRFFIEKEIKKLYGQEEKSHG